MVVVTVVEYATFGLARITIPIRNIKLIGNESALNCIRVKQYHILIRIVLNDNGTINYKLKSYNKLLSFV